MSFFLLRRFISAIFSHSRNYGFEPRDMLALGALLQAMALVLVFVYRPLSSSQVLAIDLLPALLIVSASINWYMQKTMRSTSMAQTGPVTLDAEAAIRLRYGRMRLGQNNISGAAEDFSTALDLSPSAELYHWRAVAFQRSGKPRKASADLRSAIEAYRAEGLPAYAAALEQVLRQEQV